MSVSTPPIEQLTIPTPYPVGGVHVYLVELAGRRVLFDCGPPTTAARQALREALGQDGVDWVFITHSHPDHLGLAAFCEAEYGARVVLSRLDIEPVRRLPEYLERMTELARSSGMPPELLVRASRAMANMKQSVPFPKRPLVLEEQDALLAQLGLAWRACPGHSQSDIVYLLGDDAISGDVVLQGLFQAPLLEVDLTDLRGRFNNYRAFCHTVGVLGELRGCRFHPAHGEPPASLEEHVAFVVGKLVERSRVLAPYFAQGRTPYQIACQLFGELVHEPFLLYLKLSELAYMEDFLVGPQRLAMALDAAGFAAARQRISEGVGC